MIFLYVIHFFLHVSKCSDVPTFSHIFIFRFLHVPIIVFPWFYHVFFFTCSHIFLYVSHMLLWFPHGFPTCSHSKSGFPMVFPWFSASSAHFSRRPRRRRPRAAPAAHRAAAAAGRSPGDLWPGGKVDLWKIYSTDTLVLGGSSHLVSGLLPQL